MKQRGQELKAGADKVEGESAALAKIAEMRAPDRAMVRRLHAIIKARDCPKRECAREASVYSARSRRSRLLRSAVSYFCLTYPLESRSADRNP